MSIGTKMDCAEIKAHLRTSIFGQNLICLDEIDSTNSYVLKMAREGEPEGLVVCAEFQSAGKGRLNRKWLANAGENLLFSMLVRPEREVDDVQKITLAAATVLVENIRDFLHRRHLQARINVKWPNDVLLNDRKVCGILAESVLRDKKIEALALGFGINVNTPVAQMPAELHETAASLIGVTKKPINREKFLIGFLSRFEKAYVRLERTNYDDVVADWKKNCNQFGSRIIVSTPDREEEVIFEDVSESGYLLYRTKSGKVNALVAGEIKKV